MPYVSESEWANVLAEQLHHSEVAENLADLLNTQAPLIAAMREGVEALDAYTKMQVGAHDKALTALTNMRDTLAKIEGE